MADEQAVETNTGVTPDQDGGQEQASTAGDTAADTIQVSRSELEAIRAEHEAMKRSYADQAAIYERAMRGVSGGQHQQRQEPATQAETDPFAGVPDDEWVDAGKAKAAIKGRVAPLERKIQEMETQVRMAAFAMENPEALPLIKERLPGMIDRNPVLRDIISNSQDPLRAAWAIVNAASGDSQASGKKASAGAVDVAKNIEKMVKNAAKVPSPSEYSSAGNGGGAIGHAKRIKEMSDAEFAVYSAKVASGQLKAGRFD